MSLPCERSPDNRPHTRDLRDELLVLLAEECAEVQQAVAKYLRHGGDCYNPKDPYQETNREALHRELGDLGAAVTLLERFGFLDLDKLEAYAALKKDKHLARQTPLYHLPEEFPNAK